MNKEADRNGPPLLNSEIVKLSFKQIVLFNTRKEEGKRC